MKIVVCMKQVPATSKVDIDPETGAMKRMSGETRTNPYDLFALETALAIREKTGGTVTVLTMGPPQAEEMIRDAYTMGADEGVILSDRKFAGADVLATSYALAQGIQVIGGADLISLTYSFVTGENTGGAYAPAYLVSGLLFFVICYPLSKTASVWEIHLKKRDQRVTFQRTEGTVTDNE